MQYININLLENNNAQITGVNQNPRDLNNEGFAKEKKSIQEFNPQNYWQIYDELPDGYIIDKTAGSPIARTVFITNGKSVLNGQKRALLRCSPNINSIESIHQQKITIPQENKQSSSSDDKLPFPAKTVNELARAKFKKQLLNDILVDLQICNLEGWNKKEYITELQELINSIVLEKSGLRD